MSEDLNLKITSPSGIIFEGLIIQLNLKIETGYIGILKDHVPIVSNIKPSVLEIILLDKTRRHFLIGGGLLASNKKEVKILSTLIMDVKNVDKNKASQELSRIEQSIKIEKDSINLLKLKELQEFLKVQVNIEKYIKTK